MIDIVELRGDAKKVWLAAEREWLDTIALWVEGQVPASQVNKASELHREARNTYAEVLAL